MSRDGLLASLGLPEEIVSLPEFDGEKVIIRALPLGSATWTAWESAATDDDDRNRRRIIAAVIMGVHNLDGTPAFSWDDLELLEGSSWSKVAILAGYVFRISTPPDVRDSKSGSAEPVAAADLRAVPPPPPSAVRAG